METIKDFSKNGFCVLRSVVPRELLDFVTQYALFDEMQNYTPESIIQKNNAQVAEAHSKYADPAMETMLLLLHEKMELATGLKLFPTYSYYRVYRTGDDLKPHTDRQSCEISCTLCFNYSYQNEEVSWPIYMNGVPVVLAPGDMVIYRGCELEHWREEFFGSADDWHVQGFFHYVDANGPFSNFKYDGRPSIGHKERFIKEKQKGYIQYVN